MRGNLRLGSLAVRWGFSLLLLLVIGQYHGVLAQETFPVNGVHNEQQGSYAFTNATIVKDHKTQLDKATMVIKDGIIIAIGYEVKIPKGAIILDLEGKYIYPGLIDMYTTYGIPEAKKKESTRRAPQYSTNVKGAYGWNQCLRTDFNANEHFKLDTANARKMRALGFGSVLAFRADGIARGSSVFVTLSNEKENEVVLLDKASANYSFSKGTSTQNYPNSLMGSIALMRQTYLDAGWYAQAKQNEEYNITLESWNQLQDLPQIFEVRDKYSVLRADKVGDEFGVQYIFKGSGNEYQRLDEIKATNGSFILPINFPKAYNVENPFDALQISMTQMIHWELAPSNPAFMEAAGIEFALTTSGLKNKKSFWKNLRKAIDQGLSESTALAALTSVPAGLLNVDHLVGSLEKGKIANFLITSSNLFEKDNIIFQNWIQGQPYIINNVWNDIRGTYELNIETLQPLKLKLTGKYTKPSAQVITSDSTKKKASFKKQETLLTITFDYVKNKDDSIGQKVRMSGLITSDRWSGRAQLQNGNWVNWSATFVEPFEQKDKKDKKTTVKHTIDQVMYPFSSYGWKEKPVQQSVLFKNATVWTNEREGILLNTDVVIQNGKIHAIGNNLAAPPGATTVDASGMHLTCGIIDEHSHIAISRGVNEGTQAVTAEVRIGDVINPDHVNLYRQLAGGVTTSHLLHGSANPVGGQTALIKLRWGYSPEKMKFENTDQFIKFALGENVKQSNWGDLQRVRFPQTRMGVEQVYYDVFTRAREYENRWKAYHSLSKSKRKKTVSPRRDIELDAIVDIMNSEMFITCHSYVQSEINMLMKVADSMGFRVNTFTHILEGYKVADKMKNHGVGASTFSDWWAYKYEVIDAIPYNGTILNNVGVVTAFNSDDAEMGRRLNQEAAKAVKYGGLSEEEAWKFVTLNPAVLLHIDDRVGSIKIGKHADVVLWTDNPLSIYAKVQQTYVDGILFYDSKKDLEYREMINKERMRLMNAMSGAKSKGEKTTPPEGEYDILYKCDTIESEN